MVNTAEGSPLTLCDLLSNLVSIAPLLSQDPSKEILLCLRVQKARFSTSSALGAGDQGPRCMHVTKIVVERFTETAEFTVEIRYVIAAVA